MEASQKKQYLLLVLLMTIVLAGTYSVWREQSRPVSVMPIPSVPALSTAETETGRCVVYVSGYVVRPGVYKLSGEPRAIDAVNMAGGLSVGANAFGINLAQKLTDGMQIHVPGQLSGIAAASPESDKININQADKKRLETLPGIGPALADRILEYRSVRGSFKTLDELKQVSGIGEAKYNRLKDKISL